MSVLFKAHRNTGCCILAVASLQSILRFDDVFKSVFREVGMLEVLVALLQSYSDYLKSFLVARVVFGLVAIKEDRLIHGRKAIGVHSWLSDKSPGKAP